MTPEAAPRTAAGRAWLDEEHPAGTKTLHTQHARRRMADRIEAIEAEAAAGTALDAIERIRTRITQWDSLTDDAPLGFRGFIEGVLDVEAARLAGVDSDRQPVADASEDGA